MSPWGGRPRASCGPRSTTSAAILAIELVAAARGIDLRGPLEPSPATGAVVHALRETVPGPGTDRFLAPELGAAEQFVREGGVERALADAGVHLP